MTPQQRTLDKFACTSGVHYRGVTLYMYSYMYMYVYVLLIVCLSSSDGTKQVLLPELEELSKDDQIDVRCIAISSLYEMLPIVDEGIIINTCTCTCTDY